jgi:hypothetical protein
LGEEGGRREKSGGKKNNETTVRFHETEEIKVAGETDVVADAGSGEELQLRTTKRDFLSDRFLN